MSTDKKIIIGGRSIGKSFFAKWAKDNSNPSKPSPGIIWIEESRDMSKEEWEKLYQQIPKPTCDVYDCAGNPCPETPLHEVKRKGETVRLCDKCFRNWKAGAYR